MTPNQSSSDRATSELAVQLVSQLRLQDFTLATAESCTGGLVSAAVTDIAGASEVFDRGFITYSNRAKTELLGVSAPLIDRFGAVSSEVARAMADGALQNSAADIAVSITGIAGPSGGSADKPIGLVFIAVAKRGGPCVACRHVFEDTGRAGIRNAAVTASLAALSEAIGTI